MTATMDFVNKAKLLHGDKYNYSLVKYKSCFVKVKIVCPIHGEFKQKPSNHLRSGCPKCGILLNISKIVSNTEDFIEKAKKYLNKRVTKNVKLIKKS